MIILPEYLTVDGIALATPAFFGRDLTDIKMPAEQAGEDRVIPHGGVIAKPRRKVPVKRTLPLWIFGDVDADGNPVADYNAGINAVLAYLRANVVDPVASATGTRAGVLVLAGGNRSAAIHVEGLVEGDRKGLRLKASLRISIPDGEFS